MCYPEEEWLMLSGLQHFSFCKRQWALIHLEQLWRENLRTAEGNILHERTHDASQSEKRGDLLILRDLRVFSPTLGVSGACDVVELHRDPGGIPLAKRAGRWQPYPVEYKRGVSKENDADRLQLCCQALCLEEMLCCQISSGALFYGETRRREEVLFTKELRESVGQMLIEMHSYAKRQYTPHAISRFPSIPHRESFIARLPERYRGMFCCVGNSFAAPTVPSPAVSWRRGSSPESSTTPAGF